MDNQLPSINSRKKLGALNKRLTNLSKANNQEIREDKRKKRAMVYVMGKGKGLQLSFD